MDGRLDEIEKTLRHLLALTEDFRAKIADKRTRVDALERRSIAIDDCAHSALSQLPGMRDDCDSLKTI